MDLDGEPDVDKVPNLEKDLGLEENPKETLDSEKDLTLFSSSHQDRGKVQNISKEFQYTYSEISHKEQRNYAALTEGPIKRFLARFVTMGVRHPGTSQPSEWKPLRYRSVVDIVSH